MDLDAEVADEVRMADRFKSADLVDQQPHRPVVLPLELQLLHSHQMTRLQIQRRVHRTELPFASTPTDTR